MYKKNNQPPRDYYQDLTNRIVEVLETGVKPWTKPFDDSQAAGPSAPVNAVTGRAYKGINTLILGMDPRAFTSNDPRWCTFNQAKGKGWNIRKGGKSTTIFFFKPIRIEDEKAEDGERTVPIMKAFPVFHATQIDGIPARQLPSVTDAPWTKPEAAEIILANSGAVIRTGGPKAYYSPGTDHIQLPPHEAFTGPEAWAATALHELGHWTGHPSRLNRDLTGRFGSGAYAQEELRAELASVFVGSTLGIPTDIPNHASYISSWIKALKGDKREIFKAAADAQRIADLALGFHPDYAAHAEAEASQTLAPEDTLAPAASFSAPVARRTYGGPTP